MIYRKFDPKLVDAGHEKNAALDGFRPRAFARNVTTG
jgi:hypothetical protein